MGRGGDSVWYGVWGLEKKKFWYKHLGAALPLSCRRLLIMRWMVVGWVGSLKALDLTDFPAVGVEF